MLVRLGGPRSLISWAFFADHQGIEDRPSPAGSVTAGREKEKHYAKALHLRLHDDAGLGGLVDRVRRRIDDRFSTERRRQLLGGLRRLAPSPRLPGIAPPL